MASQYPGDSGKHAHIGHMNMFTHYMGLDAQALDRSLTYPERCIAYQSLESALITNVKTLDYII